MAAYAEAWGLGPSAVEAYVTGAVYCEYYGIPAPEIVSGARSEAAQRELRRRWDAGDRAGLVVRPALYSNHTRREAFDLAIGPGQRAFAQWAPLLGLRWGGNFSTPDPVHFDLGAA